VNDKSENTYANTDKGNAAKADSGNKYLTYNSVAGNNDNTY
jgi:hypothetical protein